MFLDLQSPAAQVGEHVAVRGQGLGHLRTERGHLVEGVEEQLQRIVRAHQPADVRGDGGQNVIPAQHQAVLGIEQAQMVGGVTGRVHGHPFTAREAERLGIAQAHGGTGQVQHARDASSHRHAGATSPRNVHRRPAPRGGVPGPAHRRARLSTVDRQRVVEVDVVGFARIPEHAEPLVRDDVATGVGSQPVRTAEVIGMAVGDDHGVDVLQRHPDLLKAPLDHGVAVLVGKAGVHHRDATLVLQHVHVHVSESGDGDGELGPQHTRRDLEDLVTGRQLLLFRRSGRGRGHETRVVVGGPAVPPERGGCQVAVAAGSVDSTFTKTRSR